MRRAKRRHHERSARFVPGRSWWSSSIDATTWTIFSGPSGNLPAGVETGEAARGRGHQESVAFVDDPLRVARLDMRMPADDAMLVADAADGCHCLDDGGMIVLAGVPEVLREIAFAD